MTQTQKASAQDIVDFSQWATRNLLPCLNNNLSNQTAEKVAILIKEYEKDSNEEITESKMRNLLPHRDGKHVHLTKIVNAWRKLIPTPVNSMHCKNAEEWILKRIFPILGSGSFSKNEAVEIAYKLERKKREDKWTVTPETLIMTITSENLVDMGIDFEELKRRVELVESYMEA